MASKQSLIYFIYLISVEELNIHTSTKLGYT